MYMCLPFGLHFHEIWYIDCGFLSLTQCARFAKLGVFCSCLQKKEKKNHPMWPKLGISAENGILKDPKIVLFIGIANGNF